jgi:thioredoxin-related protein
MKTIRLLVFLVAACAASTVLAAPSADEIIASAENRASAEHKAIYLHFEASWCVWCKRLDAFLGRPDIKPVFEKYFVPVALDVEEHDDKKALETPGGAGWEKNLGGPAGLPYFAFLDAGGKVIVNSKLNGENIGYPGEPNEIAYFMEMIKKAAPTISEKDAAVIESALKEFKHA